MRLIKPPREAGIWAAAVTSLKMEDLGPFKRSIADVEALIHAKYNHGSSAEEQTRLAKRREIAGAAYPQLFGRMSAEWNAPDAEDGAWLMYSANYVLRTAGVLWALDPLTLPWRVPRRTSSGHQPGFRTT